LRRSSHEQEINPFFPRSSRTRCTHGAGSPWRRANEILKLVSTFFLPRRSSTADSSLEELCGQASPHLRGRANLQGIADCPSGYRRHAVFHREPELRCARAKTNGTLMPQIQRVRQSDFNFMFGAVVDQAIRRAPLSAILRDGGEGQLNLTLLDCHGHEHVQDTVVKLKQYSIATLLQVHQSAFLDQPGSLKVVSSGTETTWHIPGF